MAQLSVPASESPFTGLSCDPGRGEVWVPHCLPRLRCCRRGAGRGSHPGPRSHPRHATRERRASLSSQMAAGAQLTRRGSPLSRVGHEPEASPQWLSPVTDLSLHTGDLRFELSARLDCGSRSQPQNKGLDSTPSRSTGSSVTEAGEHGHKPGHRRAPNRPGRGDAAPQRTLQAGWGGSSPGASVRAAARPPAPHVFAITRCWGPT